MRLSFLALVFVAGGTASAAGPPPRSPEPFKGVVKDGLILTCGRGAVIPAAYMTACPVFSDEPRRPVGCMMSSPGMPVRWQVRSKAFWVASSMHAGPLSSMPGHPKSNGAMILERFDLAGVLRGQRIAADRAAEPDPSGWKPSTSADTPATLANHRAAGLSFTCAVYCDYQPLDDYRVRQFLLTDVLKYTGSAFDLSPEKKSTPAWSFEVFRYRAVFDEKEQEWVEGKWTPEAVLPVTFREPFFALGRGEDWYFLTESGRLFLSPDRGKGKKRKVVPVWDDRSRPILGQIQDADTGKTFLFVPPAKAGGRPAFFELSPKPKLEEYDPKAVPVPKLDEPHRTILHDARILVALKKIDGKATPKAGEKKP